MDKVKYKECGKCKETKRLNRFSLNNATEDRLSIYCKKCMSEAAGVDNSLSAREKSILLKYLPYSHENTSIVSKNPRGSGKHESNPLTLADIARENDITFPRAQGMFYKFTRLGLTTMIVQGNEDNQIDMLVFYKKHKIKEFIFGN